MSDGYAMVVPFTLSCPECAGAMRPEHDNELICYRCHIGHALTGEAMLHAQLAQLEQRLGSCLSMLNERAELCRQLGESARRGGRDAAAFDAARDEALDRCRALQALLDATWCRPEIEAEPDER